MNSGTQVSQTSLKNQKKEEDILEYLSKKLGERLVEQSDKYKRNKNLSEFLTK